MEFSDIPPGAGALLLAPIVMVLLMAQSRKLAQTDRDGWTKVNPTVGLAALGIAAMIFGIFLVYGLIKNTPAPSDESVWGLWILVPPLIASMTFGVYAIFGVGARFGPLGIEYRSLWRRRLVPWSEITEVVDSFFAGTFLRTNSGRLLISKYRRGFPALLDELRARGIPGTDSISKF